MDVDWRDNASFAAAFNKGLIYVNCLGETKPTKIFRGHATSVTSVRWHTDGDLLASCSEDYTIRIWSLQQRTCVHTLSRPHRWEVSHIAWSPTGRDADHPNRKLLLGSTCLDQVIKVWDVEAGVCLHSLADVGRTCVPEPSLPPPLCARLTSSVLIVSSAH